MSFYPYERILIKLVDLTNESSVCTRGALQATILILLTFVIPKNDVLELLKSDNDLILYILLFKDVLLCIFIFLFFLFKILEGVFPGFCMASKEKNIDRHMNRRKHRENG